MTGFGIKREHGQAYPTGTESVAAPATVGGEPEPIMPLVPEAPGRPVQALTREPGDLPLIVVA